MKFGNFRIEVGSKGDKGFDCSTLPDANGMVRGHCDRFVRDKETGEFSPDGQTLNFFINPKDCSPVIENDRILDSERKEFNDRLSEYIRGCRTEIKKGLSRG